ncbi:Beta-glucosidase, putative [Cryptococcus gattii WM276]|uniref:beta-glucosidase n=2 Tax=Cryptococcus gattii TaxID=37769 RepID=E6RA97_CRYGW|nr:Beta-glucosidase, putative [Cryptococcus gattii WM276]ADV23736.1 Beta-glucosidase, putative [Cryptococcus gattii WM276]KIR81592.1 beta-glucosidase [Cryptococcus gattii EJB2]
MPTDNADLDRSFLTANIDDLLKQLTTEEKISLLAGKDWWNTVSIPRLNIPSIKMSDGPGGARGDSFYHMTPASALPSATSLASTFSPDLVHSAGSLLALETLARNAVCLLAPTINIQRSPLGGRAFESYSEDPTLSGLIAAAYVAGLQEGGVSAAIKHFVGNDQEHERMGEDSTIAPRALREIYLRPFQIALKRSKPQAFMTAYNKLNGTHCSENEWLLEELLRKEWGFDGLVMSDWFGTYSVSESINAGLNLEMPGATRWRPNGLVTHLIKAHKIDPRQLDKVAGGVLRWVQKLAKKNEELVYSLPGKERTRTEDQAKDAEFLRRLAGESIVLLKNEMNVLPIRGHKKIAVIGPNAKAKVLTGGGSAQLRSAWSSTPWQGLSDNAPEGVELSYSLGCYSSKFLPILDENFTCPDGSSGFQLSHFPITSSGNRAEEPVHVETWDTSDMFLADFTAPGLTEKYFTQLDAVWTPVEDGEYEFGVVVTGKGWLWVDGELVIDGSREEERSSSFFGSGTRELKGRTKVKKNKRYDIRLLHDTRPYSVNNLITPIVSAGMRLGYRQIIPTSTLLSKAVSLAASSDVALLVVGLNSDWESEGYDRPNLSLPMDTDKLVSAVAEANPNTIVVIQAGSAVSMPWLDKVKGVVFAWYLGNETGNAIADIIYGYINPSGRLPITFPKRELDIAANLNYKSARTKTYYDEGIWVGYKHFNARGIDPLFPFGHGISYTTFVYSDLHVSQIPESPKNVGAGGWKMEVEVQVKNSGKEEGAHTIMFWLSPPPESPSGLKHPEWTLQGFQKVYRLKPGEKRKVKVTFDKYAISHWDGLWNTWRAELGEWTVRVGVDAQNISGEKATFRVDDDLEWRGL